MDKKNMYRIIFNLISLLFILVAIVIYYQNNSFNLIVQVLVAVAIAFAVISSYLRLKR